MPLSDKEQKLLDQLELDLVTKDPRLATSYYVATTCLIGVVLLIAGVNSRETIVGVIGFLLVGTGTYFLAGGRT